MSLFNINPLSTTPCSSGVFLHSLPAAAQLPGSHLKHWFSSTKVAWSLDSPDLPPCTISSYSRCWESARHCSLQMDAEAISEICEEENLGMNLLYHHTIPSTFPPAAESLQHKYWNQSSCSWSFATIHVLRLTSFRDWPVWGALSTRCAAANFSFPSRNLFMSL